MASSGKAGDISADITKLRRDVLKQALASLAAFIGSVNYSESFHMSAAAAGNVKPRAVEGTVVDADGRANAAEKKFVENPMYDIEKMGTSVEHANRVTRTYGVEIMSINIISATPLDAKLTTSLASGAVASAEALQAETAARGKANAVRIAAEAEAARLKIEAEGLGEAEVIKANAHADGLRSVAAALSEKGGATAMGQHIAERYVDQLAAMAQATNMVIVPEKPTDVNGVLASAFGISAQVQKITGW